MRIGRLSCLLSYAILWIGCSAEVCMAQCVSFQEAQKHIGANRCVSGKVLHVKLGNGGVHFFDFCDDFRLCPFTVVVFPGDLRQVGDVRRLEGRQIEIEGEVKGYDGRAEIILRRPGQLRGDAGRLPPLPKEYDVERHGKYSAGTLRFPKRAKTTTPKKQSPPISIEDSSEMASPSD
jgi:DNA/RNA endonuclease YhcR with UshA esterase domain